MEAYVLCSIACILRTIVHALSTKNLNKFQEVNVSVSIAVWKLSLPITQFLYMSSILSGVLFNVTKFLVPQVKFCICTALQPDNGLF